MMVVMIESGGFARRKGVKNVVSNRVYKERCEYISPSKTSASSHHLCIQGPFYH